MESGQITPYLLVFAVTSLTAVLVIAGIWVIRILREFLQTVRRVNSILDDTKTMSESITEPVTTFSNFLMGLKSGLDFVTRFSQKSEK
jgi:cytochrome c biogenesis protein CcdA